MANGDVNQALLGAECGCEMSFRGWADIVRPACAYRPKRDFNPKPKAIVLLSEVTLQS